ncbi:hypothetical protein ACFVXE_11855 [Streptomyces sp. NPDC058231]|uniref:hypothetical protein n=1 Tax=Streptomyces sp. NPDC058231 TaxID=3346392 RepID=UPI0036E7113A
MFKRDPEEAAQREAQRAVRRQERDAANVRRQEEKQALKDWRSSHPAEPTLNSAAMLRIWPSSKFGETSAGPILGGHAEFVDAGAHKAWTATRLVGGVATGGASLLAGRKNKGASVINVTFGNGAAQTYSVTPESTTLRMANQYVNAFNALAAQLAREAGQ